jgi:(2Fe-2S) ferredoxin
MGLLTHHIFVCINNRPEGHPKGSCAERGAGEVLNALQQKVEAANLWGKVKITSTGCLGPCQAGPVVVVYPEGIWYRIPTAKDAEEVIEKHVLQDTPVQRLQFDPDRI